MEEGDLEKAVKDVLGNDEEYFCTDYILPFKIEEYENIYELNNFVERLEELDEYEQQKVFYLLDDIGYDRDEALEKQEDVLFYEGMTLEEVAENFVDEGVYGEIPDNIKNYIDYKAIARDLSMEGFHQTDKGVFFYQ